MNTKSANSASAGRILVGVGGWTFEPWRANFYPAALTQARELEYASRALTAIEINGTYYRLQSRASFAKWRDETPDGFVFSMKASRYSTNRRVLAEAGDSIEKYFASGIAELGDKLGPIVWQFATSKRFDAADFEAFLVLLPAKVEGVPLRHAMEVRHDSFKCPEYVALARRFNVATVYTDSDEYPSISDSTGDFVYARLMKAQAELPSGYSAQALDRWVSAARLWADGGHPEGLADLIAPGDAGSTGSPRPDRDVFVYFINGAKERAPAAAMALIERLGGRPAHAGSTSARAETMSAPSPATPGKTTPAKAPAARTAKAAMPAARYAKAKAPAARTPKAKSPAKTGEAAGKKSSARRSKTAAAKAPPTPRKK